jgi:hypothetical protein
VTVVPQKMILNIFSRSTLREPCNLVVRPPALRRATFAVLGVAFAQVLTVDQMIDKIKQA